MGEVLLLTRLYRWEKVRKIVKPVNSSNRMKTQGVPGWMSFEHLTLHLGSGHAWRHGCEIKPCVRLHTGHGACFPAQSLLKIPTSAPPLSLIKKKKKWKPKDVGLQSPQLWTIILCSSDFLKIKFLLINHYTKKDIPQGNLMENVTYVRTNFTLNSYSIFFNIGRYSGKFRGFGFSPIWILKWTLSLSTL